MSEQLSSPAANQETSQMEALARANMAIGNAFPEDAVGRPEYGASLLEYMGVTMRTIGNETNSLSLCHMHMNRWLQAVKLLAS